MKADVFIPCVYKDLCKLHFVIEGICANCPDAGDICVSMPDKRQLREFRVDDRTVRFFNDREILDVDVGICRFRPNWVYQQLLKLFQRKTATEYVFICDADSVPIREFRLFDGDRPIQYVGPRQRFEPYFNFMKKFAGDELERRGHDDTFIADVGMFSNAMIDEFLTRYGFTVRSFADFTLRNSWLGPSPADQSVISEYELYGNYVRNFHPDVYSYRMISETRVERTQSSQRQQVYGAEEIRTLISNAKADTEASMLKLSSGCCASDVFYARNDKQEDMSR